MPIQHDLTDGFFVSDDSALLDHDLIHGFLTTQAYWANGRPREVMEAAIAGCHCFGVYGPDGQVGFARVVTDHALFAWIGDVFILPERRGRGLGHALVDAIVTHPSLVRVARMMLTTQDAHELYRAHGFTELDVADRYMMRRPST